jgi:putative ABC transport system ATP-binding protein
MSAILEIHNVKKVYMTEGTATQALKGVSITIQEGEFVAIMGPSGSGKSTLMNLLGLLDTPTSGRYFLRGRDVSSLDGKELARVRGREIGFVFQSFNLLPRATVMRNVTLPLVYSDTPDKERSVRAESALRAAGLPEELWHKRSNALSGGQMQRVAIARSLVNDPTLILADEPTGNLDTKTGDFILATFDSLRDQGRTIVLITHEPEVALHADRTIHVRDGLVQDPEAMAAEEIVAADEARLRDDARATLAEAATLPETDAQPLPEPAFVGGELR